MQTWGLRMDTIRGKKKKELIFLFLGKSYLNVSTLLHTRTGNTKKNTQALQEEAALRMGTGMVLERETPRAHTRDGSTFSAVFPNLHFQVPHFPRNNVQAPGSSHTTRNQTTTCQGNSAHLTRLGRRMARPKAWPRGREEREAVPCWASWPGPSSPPAVQALRRQHGQGPRILPASNQPTTGRSASFRVIYWRRRKNPGPGERKGCQQRRGPGPHHPGPPAPRFSSIPPRAARRGRAPRAPAGRAGGAGAATPGCF